MLNGFVLIVVKKRNKTSKSYENHAVASLNTLKQDKSFEELDYLAVVCIMGAVLESKTVANLEQLRRIHCSSDLYAKLAGSCGRSEM